MVIADDEVDATSSCISHFIYRFDSAVERDDELAPRRMRIIDALKGDSISFGIAIGNIEINGISELTQKRKDEGNGCSAIYVVIAIDEDSLFTGNGF